MEDRALMFALGELIAAVDKMRGTENHSKISNHTLFGFHLDMDPNFEVAVLLRLSAPLSRLTRWLFTPRSLAEEVHGLLKALVLFQFDKQAEKLQLAYEEALQMMEAALPEVWPEGQQNGQAPVNILQRRTFPS